MCGLCYWEVENSEIMGLILDLQVDMDMEDDDSLGMPSALDEENIEKFSIPPQEDIPADGRS